MLRTTTLLTLATLLTLLWPRSLWATSVLAVDVDQLIGQAAVIFEGEVIASEARWNEQRSSISTHVTFRVLDIIKGTLPDNTVTVRFAGGTVDEMTLRVQDMSYPEPGEQGIYFLENPARVQINPLLGWNQGRFLIRKDSTGRERILTADRTPVLALEEPAERPTDAAADKRAAGRSSAEQLPLSRGHPRGLQLGDPAHGRNQAMDNETFKRSLRERAASLQAPQPTSSSEVRSP